MYFRILSHPPTHGLAYLLADSDEREAVVIDPDPGQCELIRALLDERDLHLRLVLRTHVHAGQAGCCEALCRHTGASLVVGAGHSAPADVGKRPVVDTYTASQPPRAGSGLPSQGTARRVSHGDHLVFGNEVLRVLATPGHTPCSVSYLWRDRLFCGDVFHLDGCPAERPPANETDPGALFDSLTQRLFLLPLETLVFPAHSLEGRQVTTIGEERNRHARRMSRSRESFVTGAVRPRQTAAPVGRKRGDKSH
ncbi:MAG: MBL fold metallo-hydrolase [Rhodocyclaceae bacterium]